MRYLSLVYLSDNTLPDSMTESEYATHNESGCASGELVASHALEPVCSTTTVRIRHGKLSMTDGPFAETKQ